MARTQSHGHIEFQGKPRNLVFYSRWQGAQLDVSVYLLRRKEKMDFCIRNEQLQPSEHRQGVLWLHVQGLREEGGLKKTLRPKDG